MSLKLIGALCVIIACGSCGVFLASQHIQKIKQLESLITVLHYMECELQYRHTPLPALCRLSAQQICGKVSKVFLQLANELEQQIKPDVHRCMQVVLDKADITDGIIIGALQELGNNLGRFDVTGQILGLERIRKKCERDLADMSEHKNHRLRSYQTLGLCAGAAIAILLV